MLLLLLQNHSLLLLGHWALPMHLSVIHTLHLADHALHPILHHLVLSGTLVHLVGVLLLLLLLRVNTLLHHLRLLLKIGSVKHS